MEVRNCEHCGAQAWAGDGVINRRTIERKRADGGLTRFEGVYCDECAHDIRHDPLDIVLERLSEVGR